MAKYLPIKKGREDINIKWICFSGIHGGICKAFWAEKRPEWTIQRKVSKSQHYPHKVKKVTKLFPF